MTSESAANDAGFHTLGISRKLLAVTERLQFTTPTPIQHQSIPLGLEGKDMIGIAQTGTGKTLAFGIPMLERLTAHGGRGLIIVPTRELAEQVEGSLLPFAQAVGIRMAVFIGGAPMNRQRQMLRMNPRILIATPGRLNDHLEQRTITLKEVKVLVLDEADRMLDMGFKPQIDRILAHVPRERQTMLFSATMAQEIVKLAHAQMTTPLRIEVAPAGTTAERVEQELFVVRREDKLALLLKLLEEHTGTVLVFSRTKHGAKKITVQLRANRVTAAEIHANRSLGQRREALQGFKDGKYRVLVATDIAARGIDVTGIAVVINFDLPNDSADYVHRIGRTARAGREGKAISFATSDQMRDVRDIERLIRAPLRRKVHGAATPLHDGAPAPKRRYGGGGHRENRRNGGGGGHGRRSSENRPRRDFHRR